MCLTTVDPKPRIAERDLIVYKRLHYTNGIVPKAYSTSFHFQWKRLRKNPDVLLEAYPVYVNKYGPNSITPVISEYQVDKGYHSFLDPDHGEQTYDRAEGFKIIPTNAVFIIPKGTEYIAGWYNTVRGMKNYVSAQLIYIGKRNSLLTKLILKLYYNL